MKVIGGSLRGRNLVAPRGKTTRPTSARVREALFSILGNVDGVVAADLCAGTGALGLEALSRGAEHVCFVDPDRAALDAIRRNIENLRVGQRATVIPTTIQRSGAQLGRGRPLDLVLSDPPWPIANEIAAGLGKLLSGQLMAAGGQLVVGHRQGHPVVVDGFELEQTRSWGDSALSFFCRPVARNDETLAGHKTE